MTKSPPFVAPITAMAFAVAALLSAGPVLAMDSSQGKIEVSTVAEGFDEPWAIGFLPNNGFLVSERDGKLWVVDGRGRRAPVGGVPKVAADGQGGLLDILIPRDFATTNHVYLTYSVDQGRGSGTALGRGTLTSSGRFLQDFETLFEIRKGSSGGRHFGSRLVEGSDGYIYMTIGDRGDRPSAQDLGVHNGSVLRLDRLGKPAPGNPFLNTSGAMPEIWSFGHRNPQGATLDLEGNVVVHEHGARGGDEINRVRKGANYGWPVIAYGRHYSGFKIGEGTQKAGLEQPDLFWDPSIAPSGMMIYSGALWPEWRGDIFVGSLKFDMISRVEDRASGMQEVERLQSAQTGRVRDVREAPDGSIWFLSVDDGAVYKMAPER